MEIPAIALHRWFGRKVRRLVGRSVYTITLFLRRSLIPFCSFVRSLVRQSVHSFSHFISFVHSSNLFIPSFTRFYVYNILLISSIPFNIYFIFILQSSPLL